MEIDLFKLAPNQKKAFEKLKKAYKDCEKINIGFYNNYGTIGAFSKDKINDYSDKGEIKDIGQNSENEFKSVDSWADDTHYFTIKK